MGSPGGDIYGGVFNNSPELKAVPRAAGPPSVFQQSGTGDLGRFFAERLAEGSGRLGSSGNQNHAAKSKEPSGDSSYSAEFASGTSRRRV